MSPLASRPDTDRSPSQLGEIVQPSPDECETATTGADPRAELGSVARELARGYIELVASYRRGWGITHAEADAKLRVPLPTAARDELLAAPPDQIGWWRLSELVEQDPEAAHRLWGRIKEEATQELASGHRAARALEHDSRPWERARFLALRRAFREEWRPRGGIEDALIDAMAQAYTGYQTWLERLDIQATGEGKVEDHHLKERGYYLTPRVTTAQAMEQSATMARRFHRLFLESLRALRDGHRSQPLRVGRAAQVNVGAAQVNVVLPVELEAPVPD